jgi:hypothetical protein
MQLEYFNVDSNTDDIIKAIELNGAAVVENQVDSELAEAILSEPLSKISGTTPLLVFYFISQKA